MSCLLIQEVYKVLDGKAKGLKSEVAVLHLKEYTANIHSKIKYRLLIFKFFANLCHVMAILLWVGVDVRLHQAELMAHLIIEEMSLGNMLTLLKLQQGTYPLIEETIEAHVIGAGKLIQSLALPVRCIITAIMRDGRLIIPRGNI
jgi:Trk K+ transport system NAD-binding subunit